MGRDALRSSIGNLPVPNSMYGRVISQNGLSAIPGTRLAGQADYLVAGEQALLDLKEPCAIPILPPRVFHDRLRA